MSQRAGQRRQRLVTLSLGVFLAGLLIYLGFNMLYVAFSTFIFSLGTLALVSARTQGLEDALLDRLTLAAGEAQHA